MTVQKKKTVYIKASKQDVFNVVKASVPALFGDYVWADVEDLSVDLDDASFLRLTFKDETET